MTAATTDAFAVLTLAAITLFCVCMVGLSLWIHARAYIELQRARSFKSQADSSIETLESAGEALEEIDRGHRLNRDVAARTPDDDLREWARDSGPLTDEERLEILEQRRYQSTDDNAEHLGEDAAAEVPADSLYNPQP